jgi:hypothetical protein
MVFAEILEDFSPISAQSQVLEGDRAYGCTTAHLP